MNRKQLSESYIKMPVATLADYVMNVQLPYMKNSLTIFNLGAETVAEYKPDEPGNKMLSAALTNLGQLIGQHLEHEEKILFPFLRAHLKGGEQADNTVFNEVSLRKIKAEHASINRLFEKVRLLSNHYNPPPGSVASLKLCYARLFNFEQDMLKHIFIEEDILFPLLKQRK